MDPIIPFFWFKTEAEEAANYYVSIFKDATIKSITRTPEGVPNMQGGAVLAVNFILNGTEFIAINGNTQYPFTPASSYVINCSTQEEVNHHWDKLLAGGKPMACGWLTDKFGVTWQITPTLLPKLLGDKDQHKASKVMQAMMQMIKLDIPTLQKAYDEA
jgi:predicted 3-demethylubiquinone-9 3-methyltransferase (glyoxalase superfamily)